jgi:hypothetical protein
MAKSLFGSRDHEGYVGKEEHSVSIENKIPPTQQKKKLNMVTLFFSTLPNFPIREHYSPWHPRMTVK